MDNDHREMGGTGCKSLLPALSRSNLEDGGDDGDIRDEDQNHGDFNKRYLDSSDIVLDQPLQDEEGQRLGNK